MCRVPSNRAPTGAYCEVAGATSVTPNGPVPSSAIASDDAVTASRTTTAYRAVRDVRFIGRQHSARR